ncbi:MAG: hypothetical protein JOZ93_04040 [Sinobacteraceae bacterium]|nr:hypothetical protein [Nevskiaceae bacterium]
MTGAYAAFLAAGSGCALKKTPDLAASPSSVAPMAAASNLGNSGAQAAVMPLSAASPQAGHETAQLTASSGPRRTAANTVLLTSVPMAGNGRAARVLPDVSDDEIVARRLRQAAEAETDPELRARLWREYAIYVGGGTER